MKKDRINNINIWDGSSLVLSSREKSKKSAETVNGAVLCVCVCVYTNQAHHLLSLLFDV